MALNFPQDHYCCLPVNVHCLGSRAFNNIFIVICQLMYTFSYGKDIQQHLYCHLPVHIVMWLGH